MPFAFGRALGFCNDDIIRQRPYYNVYKTTPQPARVVAKSLAEHFRTLNQAGLAFYGDADQLVSSIGIGTGYFSDPMQFMDMQPELFITINDCIQTWTQGAYHRDTGHPMIVVDHGTAEEAGMLELSLHLNAHYPDLQVRHYPQGCGYQWITGLTHTYRRLKVLFVLSLIETLWIMLEWS